MEALNDSDIIAEAYEDVVKSAFATFFDSCVISQTESDLQDAQAKFVHAVQVARQVRDKAVELVDAFIAGAAPLTFPRS
jgi:hypothetical protein